MYVACGDEADASLFICIVLNQWDVLLCTHCVTYIISNHVLLILEVMEYVMLPVMLPIPETRGQMEYCKYFSCY